jgi:hypothetical protein
MIEKTIVVRKHLPPHRLRFQYKKKRALKAAKAYENFIRHILSMFVKSLLLVPNLSDNLISIEQANTDVHINPKFYKGKNKIVFPTRCDFLEGSICLRVKVAHEDINLLKLKNSLFYTYYIKDDCQGIYHLIREMLEGTLLHAAIEFDYEDEKTYIKS